MPRVLQMEFNELSPRLVDRFMRAGHLPNFRRMYERSLIFRTDIGEAHPNLEPWTQWVTVHTGLPFATHGISAVGEGHLCRSPRVWDIASEAGRKVWVCGSMNAFSRSRLNGTFLPDPWTFSCGTQPAEFESYFRFIQAQVLEHKENSPRLRLRDYADFIRFMTTHGLSPATVRAFIRELTPLPGRAHWKRALLLDRLQFDLFFHVYRTERPDFATFFSNSTAFLQHRYWRHMEPELFLIRPDEEEIRKHGDSILTGYRAMDSLLGRFFELAGTDTTLVLCTALGQQPCLLHEKNGGMHFYRVREFERLARFVGIAEPFEVQSAMADEFRLRFASPEAAAAALVCLQGLTLEGRKVLRIKRTAAELFLGCELRQEVPAGRMLGGGVVAGSEIRFDAIFSKLDAIKSGMHHFEGMLWIQKPGMAAAQHEGYVDLTRVAPTLLDLLGLSIPKEMTAPPLELSAHLKGIFRYAERLSESVSRLT